MLRPQLQAEHQPELAVRWRPVLGERVAGAGRSGAEEAPVGAGSGSTGVSLPLVAPTPATPINSIPTRPLFLRPLPAPVQAVSLFPEGPPIRFEWDGSQYPVVRCRGPERIETGWWRERHIRRDYYLVETDDGRWFWLFRERNSGAWFLHGEF